MQKLYFSLVLGSFLALAIAFSASAEISANVDIQRYGVRNLSNSESVFSQNTKAAEGQDLEFSISLRNISANQANGAVLYVYLPVGFPLDTNSIYIDGTRTGGNISNGLFLGNINSNSQKEIIFKTRVNSYFNGYAAIQALVAGDNFNSSSKYVAVTKNSSGSDATVNSFSPIYTPTPTPTLTPNPTPTPVNNVLGVSVLEKNLTKQETTWQKAIKAEPGDLIQFSIMLSANTRVTARNVYVKDTLDNFLDFVPGSVTINNALASDVLLNGPLPVGDVAVQENKFVKFQARVRQAEQFGQEQIILSNTVNAWAENNSMVVDSSSVSVSTKQTGEKKPAAVVATVSKKNTGTGNVAMLVKPKLEAPKETAKTASTKNFLFGTIAFGSFGLLLILILLALVILLFTFLVQEKKKNKDKPVTT